MVKKKQNSDICSEDVEILDDVWDQDVIRHIIYYNYIVNIFHKGVM